MIPKVAVNQDSQVNQDGAPACVPDWKIKHRERDVDDFSCFQEGDVEPTLGKTIKFLIYHAKSYIVYIDSENFVEWATNDSYGKYHEGLGTVMNGVSHLEALSMSLLPPRHKLPFRRLLGESLARALSERRSENALAILDDAKRYLAARGKERARSWYLSAAAIVTTLVTVVVVIFWLRRGPLINSLGKSAFDVIVGAGVGSIGALLSIITRSDQISMDASAGWKVHYLESMARVAVGVAGAFLVALAIKANFVLGSINAVNSLSLLMVICIMAGASERFVPSLIKHIESTVTFTDTKQQ